jgi:uncharacterized RDD family membrane protein YckC
MYCTRCGNPVDEGAAFCRQCGQAVVARPTAPSAGDWQETAPAAETASSSVNTSLPPLVASASPAFMPYAGFWLRVAAYLIDRAILSIAFGAILAIAFAFVGWDRLRGIRPGLEVRLTHFNNLSALVQQEFQYRRQFNFLAPAIFGAIVSVLLAMLVVSWLYYAFMESSSSQGTFGKIALGLIVTDSYGARIAFGRASGRFFARRITALIPLFIGYIMIAFTEKRQALHDLIADCLVLKKA